MKLLRCLEKKDKEVEICKFLHKTPLMLYFQKPIFIKFLLKNVYFGFTFLPCCVACSIGIKDFAIQDFSCGFKHFSI